MVDLNIPVGVSDFEKLRENNYYYIDKTGFISKLLQTKSAEVTLITRPRRFGKTLGMRMLASFFDIRKDSRALFEGLEITSSPSLCQKWMNQYPTLFISFKDVDGLNFLQGKSVSYVNRKAFEGTVLAHHDGGVPNIVVHVPDFSEYSLGYLIYFFEKACAISGYLLGVNPFNQPGVESYKKNMFALLGKPGYEQEKEQLEARLKQ